MIYVQVPSLITLSNNSVIILCPLIIPSVFLQCFLHKCPTIGSCQESHKLIMKLHNFVRYILILYFHICLLQVPSLLHSTHLKFCICFFFLPCLVLAAFLDWLQCKHWLLCGICSIVGPTTALSVAMQQCCCQLYGKQSGHKNTQRIKRFYIFSFHFLSYSFVFLESFSLLFSFMLKNQISFIA